uniref:H15 domain-containing protein n=1 Tax=Eptatretus burgeri TaxID=7764 RepID=A0A8C4QSM7_EPTBU
MTSDMQKCASAPSSAPQAGPTPTLRSVLCSAVSGLSSSRSSVTSQEIQQYLEEHFPGAWLKNMAVPCSSVLSEALGLLVEEGALKRTSNGRYRLTRGSSCIKFTRTHRSSRINASSRCLSPQLPCAVSSSNDVLTTNQGPTYEKHKAIHLALGFGFGFIRESWRPRGRAKQKATFSAQFPPESWPMIDIAKQEVGSVTVPWAMEREIIRRINPKLTYENVQRHARLAETLYREGGAASDRPFHVKNIGSFGAERRKPRLCRTCTSSALPEGTDSQQGVAEWQSIQCSANVLCEQDEEKTRSLRVKNHRSKRTLSHDKPSACSYTDRSLYSECQATSHGEKKSRSLQRRWLPKLAKFELRSYAASTSTGRGNLTHYVSPESFLLQTRAKLDDERYPWYNVVNK